jgi:hypothetical protein
MTTATPEVKTIIVQKRESEPFALELLRHDFADQKVRHTFALDAGGGDLADLTPTQMLALCRLAHHIDNIDVFGPILRRR